MLLKKGVSGIRKNKNVRNLLLLLVLGLALRLILSPYLTYYPDLYIYQLWSLDLIRHGFKNFYSIAVCDYLPFYLYILWIAGKIFYFINAKLFFVAPEIIYKLPAIFSDIGCAFFLYLLAKRFTSAKNSLIIVSLFLLNPAFIFLSAFWGQTESLVSLFILGSLYFMLENQVFLSSLFLALAQTIKPVGILLIPFFLLMLYLNKVSIKKITGFICLFAILYVLVFIPFNPGGNLLSFIIERNFYTANFYNYVTLNAFSFWAFILAVFKGTINRVSDKEMFLFLSLKTWGRLIFTTIYTFLLILFTIKFREQKEKTTFTATFFLLIFLSMFLFITGFHERHVYYGLIFLPLLYFSLNNIGRAFSYLLYLLFIANLLFSYSAASLINLHFPIWTISIFSLAYLLIFLYLLINLIRESSI